MSQNVINILLVADVVIAILLTISIILQNRAEGLGSLFGGGGEVFRTKRGLEKFLYYSSITLGILLSVLSFVIVKYSAS